MVNGAHKHAPIYDLLFEFIVFNKLFFDSYCFWWWYCYHHVSDDFPIYKTLSLPSEILSNLLMRWVMGYYYYCDWEGVVVYKNT